MIYSLHPQGSDEWFNDKAGVVSASCMTKVRSKGRGSAPSLTRLGYMRQLANEIVTGKYVQEGFKSKWMERGNDQEEESRLFYSMVTGYKVELVGLAYLDELKRIGASLDGEIEDDGALELKNPKLSTHIGYCLDNACPPKYNTQIQTQLWVTDRKWCDFASYHPEAYKMLFIKRVYRDDDYIKILKTDTYKFIGELDVMVDKMRESL